MMGFAARALSTQSVDSNTMKPKLGTNAGVLPPLACVLSRPCFWLIRTSVTFELIDQHLVLDSQHIIMFKRHEKEVWRGGFVFHLAIFAKELSEVVFCAIVGQITNKQLL